MCCLYCRCCVEPESSQAWKVLFSLTAVFTLVHMMLDFHVTLPPFCCLRSNAGNVDISVSCRNKEDKCTWHDFFRNTSSGKWRAEMGVVRVYFILFEAGAIPAPILAKSPNWVCIMGRSLSRTLVTLPDNIQGSTSLVLRISCPLVYLMNVRWKCHSWKWSTKNCGP